MYDKNNEKGKYGNFPDPFADYGKKTSKSYGLKYAKAIEKQWGNSDDERSLFRRRLKDFETNRDYANGTQDTSIYKQILNSLDPNSGDGTLLNLDWSPVPIIPKFVKIVVNNILSRKPYPNVKAIDPLSQSEKDRERAKTLVQVENREFIEQLNSMGVDTKTDTKSIPETPEEAEIFMDANIKTAAEIAAQVGTNMTLEWNDFDQRVYRRVVNDLVACGMGVVKRSNDPNYGISEEYIDPAFFFHSYTEDPPFSDLIYAGHIKKISISELKRLAGDELTEEQYEKIAQKVKGKYQNRADKLSYKYYDETLDRTTYGYDEFIIEIMDFEFISTDDMMFEEKSSKFGNTGFYYKGFEYNPPKESVYERKPRAMNIQTVFGGSYVVGCDYMFNYGQKRNIPKNAHDITRARLSYSVVATNLRRMMPKSLVGSVIGFADQLQLSHLKLQQAIAKAKPDGLIVDIEGLENVQLGKGGELQPLDIQDIYEQTGVFYYRSKNPEGGFQNPPVRSLDNSIRNINELISIYNHNLRLIRDTTGINEVMDGTSPKGELLVGVSKQAVAAGNNAIYDITNSAVYLYTRVCEDIIKCLQILPTKSVLFKAYERAIGKANMEVLASFSKLPMYNFGVKIQTEMDETEKAYLEQNIQIALSQKEIDLEDAIAVRQLKDIDQAERLLIIRRKKRMRLQQQIAQQNSQAQAQANAQAAQAASQGKMQEIQIQTQADIARIQAEAEAKARLLEIEYRLKGQIESLKLQTQAQSKQMDMEFKQEIESNKEDAKDQRVKKQAVEQSKLISQRKGQRAELREEQEDKDIDFTELLTN
jgi:hypothetical protein